MSVIISEIEAEVSEEAGPQSPGEGPARPAEGQAQQLVLDLLTLSEERKERLAID